MRIKFEIHIVLDESPALLKLLKALDKCEDEQVRKEIMDKLNAIQKDLEATIS